MPRHSKVTPLAVLCAVAIAQNDSPSISLSRMRADLQYLCSEKLRGRASLSPGADLAARYIAVAFKKAGLAPAAGDSGFLQQFLLIATLTPPSAVSPPADSSNRAHTQLALVREG